MDFAAACRALLMIAAASSVPWAVGRYFGDRWAWPLDFGCVLRDGDRLFGAHKTWRGLVAGVLACTLIGWALGPGWLAGCGVGAVALALTLVFAVLDLAFTPLRHRRRMP